MILINIKEEIPILIGVATPNQIRTKRTDLITKLAHLSGFLKVMNMNMDSETGHGKRFSMASLKNILSLLRMTRIKKI